MEFIEVPLSKRHSALTPLAGAKGLRAFAQSRLSDGLALTMD
jgi:hypothetical protein